MTRLTIELVIIDPQRDFCDPHGSLYVPGAQEDIKRLADCVTRLRGKLSDIHVTLDSHHVIDISHPSWWMDGARSVHPQPFTLITAAEVRAGRWTTTAPNALKRSIDYLDALEATKRYPHVIWPEHCLIGSEGATVMPELFGALTEWEKQRYGMVDYVSKGSNPWTEHFSGIQAEVPDPKDPSTHKNMRLIQTLEAADIILLAGEARSHCVANTVRDIVGGFSDPSLAKKIHLLQDAMSDVPTFDQVGRQFIDDMRRLGMSMTTTRDFLASV